MSEHNNLTATEKEAVWSAFEKAIEHAPVDALLRPDAVMEKLVKARLALRTTCPCCGRQPK